MTTPVLSPAAFAATDAGLARHDIIGAQIEYVCADDIVRQVVAWAKDGSGGYVVVCNVHSVMTALDDPTYMAVFLGARVRLPDSMVLQKARAFLYGVAPPETLLGSRLTERLCDHAAAETVTVGFYGARDATIAAMADALCARAPGLTVAHQEAPPFRDLSEDEVAASCAAIRAAGVQLLFVGLGCPKQERWMARAGAYLPDVTQIGVGAAFDTLAGVVSPAPAWVHQTGLEWAYRLMKEPRRLYQRYLSTSPSFLWRVVQQKLRGARATTA